MTGQVRYRRLVSPLPALLSTQYLPSSLLSGFPVIFRHTMAFILSHVRRYIVYLPIYVGHECMCETPHQAKLWLTADSCFWQVCD
ncbi:hypothetical protein LX36DRAFT_206294 [Colletotrichum falcatum]|nr:hypothetical protein LX36DRAFT_206294 [Colletotrichum falcatum]